MPFNNENADTALNWVNHFTQFGNIPYWIKFVCCFFLETFKIFKIPTFKVHVLLLPLFLHKHWQSYIDKIAKSDWFKPFVQWYCTAIFQNDACVCDGAVLFFSFFRDIIKICRGLLRLYVLCPNPMLLYNNKKFNSKQKTSLKSKLTVFKYLVRERSLASYS